MRHCLCSRPRCAFENLPDVHLDISNALNHVSRTQTKEQMPDHWRSPGYKLGGISDRIFTLLCLAAFGTPNLQSEWESSQDDDTFKEYKDSVIERVTTISVLVRLSLLLFSVL